MAVIAECKRRSPSKGLFAAEYDPVAIARRYAEAGASAISVLTEPDFFEGSLEHLAQVREAVDLPLLRKDFILDPLQVAEARAFGADAVLIIARILEEDRVRYRELLAAAQAAGLEALVELHSLREVDFALAEGPRLVGVNNRDLETFETRLEVCREVRPYLGDGVIAVAESGIGNLDDVVKVRDWGYQAVLVGEALMRGGAKLLEEVAQWR
jgi:indole-3-glycerol phosphate synthase